MNASIRLSFALAIIAADIALCTHKYIAESATNETEPDKDVIAVTAEPIQDDYCTPFENSTEVGNFPHFISQNSTRCGEIFDCVSGGIFYKPFEKVGQNERCVWTVAVASATGYDVTVQHFGYTPQENNVGDHSIIISDFNLGRKPNHFIPTNSSKISVRNASMIIITFVSGAGDANEAGFVLHFKAIFEGTLSRPVSPSSRHFLIGENEYFLKYGTSGNYHTYYLSSFLFVPSNNTFRPGKSNVVIYMQNSVINCAEDYLKVYMLNTTCIGPQKWQFQGRICGSESTRELIRSAEPILLIFEGTSYYSRHDFQFTFSPGV